MEIDGPVTLADIIKVLMLIGIIWLAFRAGRAYEEMHERKWRDG